MIFLNKGRLSVRSFEYFGGDVQAFHFCCQKPGVYVIQQYPHWGNVRTVAVTHANNAREAATIFNTMAKEAENAHA